MSGDLSFCTVCICSWNSDNNRAVFLPFSMAGNCHVGTVLAAGGSYGSHRDHWGLQAGKAVLCQSSAATGAVLLTACGVWNRNLDRLVYTEG